MKHAKIQPLNSLTEQHFSATQSSKTGLSGEGMSGLDEVPKIKLQLKVWYHQWNEYETQTKGHYKASVTCETPLQYSSLNNMALSSNLFSVQIVSLFNRRYYQKW